MNKKQTLRVQGVLYQNDIASLQRALDSLSYAISKEIVSADGFLSSGCIAWGDASPAPLLTEETLLLLKAKLPAGLTLEYTYFHENTGYGKGHNLLSKQDKNDADLLLILNPDILMAGNFFSEMIPPLFDPKVGLTEARQTPVEHPKQYDLETGETAWASGACFLIRKALFDELGGFDDISFFMYFEDVDLSLRIRQKKLRLVYCPNAPVYHAKRFTSEGTLTHTQTEIRYTPLAKLIFAYKWRKEDEVQNLLDYYTKAGDVWEEAATEFFKRKKNEELIQIEGDTSVYQPNRWKNRFDL